MSTRGQGFDPVPADAVARSKMGNIGQWYPAGNESGAIPDVSFGGVQNGINGGLGNIPYHNENPVFSFVDNHSKVVGTHAFKFGAYIERMRKDEVGNGNTRGAFTFDRNTNNPFDSNYAFSNALLGNFNSYSEASFRNYSLYRYTQVELYAQDSWKVSKRLTLEIGIRAYSAPPAHDIRQYPDHVRLVDLQPGTAAVLYRPAIDPATGKRVADGSAHGVLAPNPYIGLFVPGSGSYAPGMVVGGVGNTPGSLYTTPLSFGSALWLRLRSGGQRQNRDSRRFRHLLRPRAGERFLQHRRAAADGPQSHGLLRQSRQLPPSHRALWGRRT